MRNNRNHILSVRNCYGPTIYTIKPADIADGDRRSKFALDPKQKKARGWRCNGISEYQLTGGW